MSESYAIQTGIDALPRPAIEKLNRLGEEIEDLQASLRGLSDAEDKARAKIEDAQLALDRAAIKEREAPAHVRGNRNPGARNAEAELEAEIERQERFLERTAKAIAVLNERLGPFLELQRRVENFLEIAGTEGGVRPFEGAVEVPGDASLSGVRQTIKLLKSEIRHVRHAPRSTGELEAVLDRELARLRRYGAPDLSALIDGATDELKWPTSSTNMYSFGQLKNGERVNSVGQNRSFDTPAILAWLFPERMRDSLREELRQQFDGEGISAEERAARIQALGAELLAAERLEEAIIEIQMPEAPRRADLDLRAFLALSDDVPVPSGED